MASYVLLLLTFLNTAGKPEFRDRVAVIVDTAAVDRDEDEGMCIILGPL